MDIQHTQFQASNITATPIRFTDHSSSEMVSTAYNLPQQGNIFDSLRLTHQIVDKQIDGAVQNISFFLDNLQEQLSTLKNAGIFQNNEDPMKTIAAHVAIALVDINKATTLKHNLEILKQRDFKPTKPGAVVLRSIQALGGAGGSRNIIAERKQKIEHLKAQKKELEEKIKKWEKACEKSRKKLKGFRETVRKHEENMSELLRTEGGFAEYQYKCQYSTEIAEAELAVAMQKVEDDRGHQQLQEFNIELSCITRDLATEERLLHPGGSSTDVGCSSRRRWGF